MGHAGGFTKSGPVDSQRRFPRSFFLFMQLRPYFRVRRARSGKSEVGRERPPLFAARCGRGGAAQFTFAQHPLGGSLPSKISPGGEGQK